ncbi:GatB/YqeY domain-containing protein [Thermoactinomyces vulgaris]|uniref:GatB/YqeY domain-containing protein n=2 Tax=Thermoactinomyces vulgaris TaxID=2026 RepID=A0ABS0QGJ8_THEVU|nr:GatB/YqeY domain-containing protein [Thermoactinomyces vulgaris]MBA4550627.1 GatB/YqeY domain-containing protein [Thermoactinomyces vulgaris]MBA4596314.1 GatB/YqeY domain-containing protein [Thermoactinomyces vulgaris]MBH8588403.1 GatB/YqeY domain-containing protein [Thermoactinomyces vulgaris]MCF6134965.1 GatB/YqeY domain-containing protein [Thermoactinomyces vulgaris]QCV55057.1 GatB/YqeY domain-containing protein [Thermoactinomyces vulgaris]
MSLTNQLDQEMKMALKNKDKQKLSTIRMLKSAIKKEEIDKKRPLNDDEIISVIMREVKQRKDSLAEYKAAGRDDLAEKEQAEIDILSAYLPEQMSEEELKALVQQVIDEVGAGSKADMGKVMSAIMPKVKGRAEGRLVNRMVQEALQ